MIFHEINSIEKYTTNIPTLALTLTWDVRVRAPCKHKAKIIITERQYSVLRSDWSRHKLVIFIFEMDQSENRTRHQTRKSIKKIEISDTN